jgi:hypothetical protein
VAAARARAAICRGGAVCSAGDAGGLVDRQRPHPRQCRLSGGAAAVPDCRDQARRGRWVQLAGAIAGDPKLIAFLEYHHGRADYLLAAVSARQAAADHIATGKPVMALGGFSGGDPILTVDDFARLVAEHRVRFALIGDGSERNRQVFGEGRQKPLIDWIQANGKRVDAERWLTPITAADPGTASGRALRAAESVGARLYDVRPADDDGG